MAGTLKDRLADEMRRAMKAREKTRLGALRLLTASVKNREVELGHELSDEELVEMAAREVKRRKEAIQAYEAAGRQDRAEQEREEQRVLEAYLPAALSDDEVGALIEEAMRETGASAPGDLGKVMGHVMAKGKGKVDGNAVRQMVQQRLATG